MADRTFEGDLPGRIHDEVLSLSNDVAELRDALQRIEGKLDKVLARRRE